jgi:hypothetical protein
MPTNSRKSSSAEQTERPNGAHKGGNGSVAAAETGTNGGTTHGLLGGIKQNVTTRVDEQKNRAADGLGGIANVFRSAGNELRNENEMVAQYVDMASDQLRRFADQIRQKGVTDMLDDVHNFARRRPALFIGGAFLVGLGLARFLKSTGDRQASDQQDTGFSSVDPMTASSVPSYGSGGVGEAGY